MNAYDVVSITASILALLLSAILSVVLFYLDKRQKLSILLLQNESKKTFLP